MGVEGFGLVDAIQATLASTLLRTLQLDQSLTVPEAIERLYGLREATPFLDFDHHETHRFFEWTASHLRRRGVLNPDWLARTGGIHLYYYMFRAQPGWLHLLEEQTRASAQTSHYVIYGEWDALISLHGVAEEAETLLERITAATAYEWVNMAVAQVLLFHRHRTPGGGEQPEGPPDPEVVNGLVADYDDSRFRPTRAALERAGVLLGSTWQLDDQPSSDVTAYLGITARGPMHNIASLNLLDELLRHDLIRSCLVHFMELDRARPFAYLAKLVCRDLEELDRVTDAIVARRVGRVTLDTTTFVIARGTERMPLLSGEKSPEIVMPDTNGIAELANHTVGSLSPDAIASYNLLDAPLQMVVLDSFYELQEQIADAPWDRATQERLQSAIELFRAAALAGAERDRLIGPVMNVAMTVEMVFKDVFERLLRRAYGADMDRARSELKVRTRKIDELSLARIAALLRTMRSHPSFLFVIEALEAEWLDRLDAFVVGRGQWADARRQPTSNPRLALSEARQLVALGIALVRWVFQDIRPLIDAEDRRVTGAAPEITLRDPGTREFGIFISHSTADGEIAERIANVLRGYRYPVWFAEWAIQPGDSIVDRIRDALARHDTLLVLVSRKAVASNWVRVECNKALMDQLAGQDVTVVPVLIERCELPAGLRTRQHIDMQGGHYDEGLRKLIDLLAARRQGRRFDAT
jgi:hypothetical protein